MTGARDAVASGHERLRRRPGHYRVIDKDRCKYNQGLILIIVAMNSDYCKLKIPAERTCQHVVRLLSRMDRILAPKRLEHVDRRSRPIILLKSCQQRLHTLCATKTIIMSKVHIRSNALSQAVVIKVKYFMLTVVIK